jgi:iron(III) transport system substrate-binding protein
MLYGENGAIEFQKVLDENVRYYYDDRSGAYMVEPGEVGFTIANSETALAIVNQGYSVTISFPIEGVMYGETCCSILKSSKNYSNVRALLTWFLSDSYVRSIDKNKIPYVLPTGVENYKDEYIDYNGVKFLISDFSWKVKNRDKFIEDFRNYVLNAREE